SAEVYGSCDAVLDDVFLIFWSCVSGEDSIYQRKKDWCITYGALRLTSLLSECPIQSKGKRKKTSSDEKLMSDLK
ncbi:hypothetical protein Tco_1120224, partial [Tanacetum coccineum]